MFEIHNKRKQFWQWDTGQRLIVNADVCSEVHFCNGTSDCSLVCEVYEEDGIRLVNVPNILLQESKAIRVYAYVCEENDHHTQREMIFPVFPRSKPEDYVYTETEIKRYSDLEEDIAELGDYVHEHESLGITGATVGQTVKITEVDEDGRPVKWEAADIPAKTNIDRTLSIEGSAADAKAVGDKVAKLSSAIANIPSGKDGIGIQSVVQTTTSTEDGGTNVVTVTTSDGTSSTFQVKNGSKGSTGKAGADGHTPVKGTDYFTAADKREIAEEAAGMVSIPDKLPNPNALTFTGAVTGIYDGSEPLNVEIPSGGSGGSAEPGYKDATTLFDVTLDDTTGGLKSYEYDVSGIEKTDVIIINILFPESYTGQITIKNQSREIAREFPSSVKGMAIGLKVMNGRYMHSCASSANINARLDMPLSLFYGQLSGASGFERPNAPDTITKLEFTLSTAFVSGTRIRAYRW